VLLHHLANVGLTLRRRGLFCRHVFAEMQFIFQRETNPV
jgi:hypothetical protein